MVSLRIVLALNPAKYYRLAFWKDNKPVVPSWRAAHPGLLLWLSLSSERMPRSCTLLLYDQLILVWHYLHSLTQRNFIGESAGEIWYAVGVMSAVMLFGLAIFFFIFAALPYGFKVRRDLRDVLSCWALTFPNGGFSAFSLFMADSCCSWLDCLHPAPWRHIRHQRFPCPPYYHGLRDVHHLAGSLYPNNSGLCEGWYLQVEGWRRCQGYLALRPQKPFRRESLTVHYRNTYIPRFDIPFNLRYIPLKMLICESNVNFATVRLTLEHWRLWPTFELSWLLKGLSKLMISLPLS